eukprot:GHVL01015232.1.p1 GENE.GHVL01015232.1~~GHVL01015232.1.p1  ORF type:complete len:827 (+),score=104.10 GHVL01015232.1:23-2482(+)
MNNKGAIRDVSINEINKKIKKSPISKIVSCVCHSIIFLCRNIMNQFLRCWPMVWFAGVAVLEIWMAELLVPFETLAILFILLLRVTRDIAIFNRSWRKSQNIMKRKCRILDCERNQLVTVQWKDLQVGHTVYLEDGDMAPGDLCIIISESDDCFVECSVVHESHFIPKKSPCLNINEDHIFTTRGNINSDLNEIANGNFTGVMTIRGLPGKRQLDIRNYIYMGSVLKDSGYIYATVVFTGDESFVGSNSIDRFQRSSCIEIQLHKLLLINLVITIVVVMISLILHFIFLTSHAHIVEYFYIANTDGKYFFASILVFFLRHNSFVPSVVLIMFDLCRLLQRVVLLSDNELFPSKTYSHLMPINLEDFGQVDVIFVEKEGTLTASSLDLCICSIGDALYNMQQRARNPLGNDMGSYKQLVPVDDKFLESDESRCCVNEFVKCMTFCSQINYINFMKKEEEMSKAAKTHKTKTPQNTIEYSLSEASKSLGNSLHWISKKKFQYKVLDKNYIVNIVGLIGDVNGRGRVSVVTRSIEGCAMYCMGSDSSMISGMSANDQKKIHRRSSDFRKGGSRPIVLTCKRMTEADVESFRDMIGKARLSQINQLEQIINVAQIFERDLHLLGMAAVQEQLVEGVPETMTSIIEGGIALWLLTQEDHDNALTCARLCGALTPQMKIIEFSHKTQSFSRLALSDLCVQLMAVSMSERNRFSFVVDAAEFQRLTNDSEGMNLFMSIAQRCTSLILWGASTNDKMVMIKQFRQSTSGKTVTVAIGNGLNGLVMTKETSIGISIGTNNLLLPTSCVVLEEFGQIRRTWIEVLSQIM